MLVCVEECRFGPPVMFMMNGIPTIARGEGVGMDGVNGILAFVWFLNRVSNRIVMDNEKILYLISKLGMRQ